MPLLALCCMSFFASICDRPRWSSAFDVPTTPLRRPEFSPLACGSRPISSPNSANTAPTSSVCISTV
eukprot:scaffold145069_cov178-Phaeocystis_antarctica.AAC.1